MSLEMHTYVPEVDDSLIPIWLLEMKKVGMDCEIHPEVKLASHSGFLPFKLRIQDSAHTVLNGVEFLTGFEYYVGDFSLKTELEKRPRSGGIGKAFGNRSAAAPYATPELDERLKKCSKLLIFSWGTADLFELRMATVSSAVLANITGGVSSYPADGIWYDRTAAQAVSEARAYENSVKAKNVRINKFQKWL